MAPPPYPTYDDVRPAIDARLSRRPLTIDWVAHELKTSRSQIQRVMRHNGTSFRQELKRARLTRALLVLLRDRKPVSQAAAEVGVTRDHLRVILVQELGVTPANLRRTAHILARARRDRRRVPPKHGTPGYWSEHRR